MASSSLRPEQLYSRGVKIVVGQLSRLTDSQWGLKMPLPSLCTILLPKCQPILVAVLVSQGRPSTTSPIAQMLSTLVLSTSSSLVFIFLLFVVCTPIFWRFSVSVVAVLPTANKTVSNSSAGLTSLLFWFLMMTLSFPFSCFSILQGREVQTMLTFLCCRSLRMNATMSLSKERRQSPRVIRLTLYPIPFRNPAISTATQPPPTMSVFPGGVFFMKMSSLVMAWCAPSSCRQEGLVPVAIRKLLALIQQQRGFWWLFSGRWPVLMYSQMILVSLEQTRVSLSLKVARQFRQSRPSSLLMLAIYPKLIDFMQPCTLFFSFAQLNRFDNSSCLLRSLISSGRSHPYSPELVISSRAFAAWCISFLGMQPTFTQVPPSPHFDLWDDSSTKSMTITLRPCLLASKAVASPPEPPPITAKSYCFSQVFRAALGALAVEKARARLDTSVFFMALLAPEQERNLENFSLSINQIR